MRIENLPKKKSWVLRRTQDLYRLFYIQPTVMWVLTRNRKFMVKVTKVSGIRQRLKNAGRDSATRWCVPQVVGMMPA